MKDIWKKEDATLYYMQEQFYAANNSVNNILKIYYPGQFGERHFLTYPIGHFFLSITNMWNAEEGGIQIENMNDIVECLNSGFIKEETPGKLYSIFNRTKEFFVRAETIDQIRHSTEAWSMAANYNRLTGQHISRYTKETESFDGFSRWIEAYGTGSGGGDTSQTSIG